VMHMSSDAGHEIMVSRSIQAEGTFGDLKENYRYSRLRRRGLENVKFEVLIVAMGHNIRKLNNRNRMSCSELERYGKLKEQKSEI
ncbi:transposase, partial [Ileibacterium valens]